MQEIVCNLAVANEQHTTSGTDSTKKCAKRRKATMRDKPLKHSERDNVVQGLNLLDIPHSIIHVILSYLDKNSLVAVSQSCQTLKLVSYSSNLWRNDVVDLSVKSLRNVSELTIHSLVERRIRTLKAVDAYTDDNSKEACKSHRHSSIAPAGKISRIPWGISGDCDCWWRESTGKFGL